MLYFKMSWCIVVSCLVCIVVSCLVCIVSYLVCIVVSCLVCIVVVVLCVLLSSYVYLLYCVCIAVFYFRCRTAGYKSVFGRSCDRPPRTQVFLGFPVSTSKC